jgi:hypothetical protein
MERATRGDSRRDTPAAPRTAGPRRTVLGVALALVCLASLVDASLHPLAAHAVPGRPRGPARARTPRAPAKPGRLPRERAATPTTPSPTPSPAPPAAAASTAPPRRTASEEWRPVSSGPRIGARLSALATDPWSRDRLWIGTEEGTLLRSDDGGATFVELEPLPVELEGRAARLEPPGRPSTDDAPDVAFSSGLDPPFGYAADDLSTGFDPLFMALAPDNQGRSFAPKPSSSPQSSLLDDVVSGGLRRSPDPILRILVCPGAFYGLLVATGRELLGSSDDGATFVRVLSSEGAALITDVHCAPDAPENLVVGTESGVFLSRDGGLTFETAQAVPLGYGGSAVHFVDAKRLYVASDEYLMELVGLDATPSLVDRYPDFDYSDTAPWEPIRWIESAPNGAVWLATDDGVRRAAGPDAPFEAVGRLALEREQVRQVVRGAGPDGRERYAIVTRQRVWSADATGDGVEIWFEAFTRRSVRQVAWLPARGDRAGSWWVLTTGELWTTAPDPNTTEGTARGDGRAAPNAAEPTDDALARWARARAARTPDLATTLRDALAHLRLDEASVGALQDAYHASAWLPRVDAQLTVGPRGGASVLRFGPLAPYETSVANDQTPVGLTVQLLWSFDRAIDADVLRGPARAALYGLRNQLAFATEDAWHERRLHLATLADVRGDRFAREVLRERVLALESLLELWTGRRFETQDDAPASPPRKS